MKSLLIIFFIVSLFSCNRNNSSNNNYSSLKMKRVFLQETADSNTVIVRLNGTNNFSSPYIEIFKDNSFKIYANQKQSSIVRCYYFDKCCQLKSISFYLANEKNELKVNQVMNFEGNKILSSSLYHEYGGVIDTIDLDKIATYSFCIITPFSEEFDSIKIQSLNINDSSNIKVNYGSKVNITGLVLKRGLNVISNLITIYKTLPSKNDKVGQVSRENIVTKYIFVR